MEINETPAQRSQAESPRSPQKSKDGKKGKGRRIAGDKELGIDSYDEDSCDDDNMQD
mgnify:CR=1 FL=1